MIERKHYIDRIGSYAALAAMRSVTFTADDKVETELELLRQARRAVTARLRHSC